MDFPYIASIMPDLLWATFITIRIALAGFMIAILLGLMLAMLRLSHNRFLSGAAFRFSEFVKLTPLMVQLFFAYYVLPEFGIVLPAEPTGIIVIGVHYACYTSEVFRSGILSVDRGQWEAAMALSLSRRIRWQRVILPQAIRPMVPALGNYLIQLFKEVPLLSTITVYELLNTANLIAGQTFRYLEVLTTTGAIFFVVSYFSALAIRKLET